MKNDEGYAAMPLHYARYCHHATIAFDYGAATLSYYHAEEELHIRHCYLYHYYFTIFSATTPYRRLRATYHCYYLRHHIHLSLNYMLDIFLAYTRLPPSFTDAHIFSAITLFTPPPRFAAIAPLLSAPLFRYDIAMRFHHEERTRYYLYSYLLLVDIDKT